MRNASVALALTGILLCLIGLPTAASSIDYLKQVQELSSKGDYSRAKEIVLAKLHKNADDPDLLLDLAGCYFNLGQFDEARKLIEKSLEASYSPEQRYCPAEKLFNQAECFYFMREYSQALSKYRDALAIIEQYDHPLLERKLSMSIASCFRALNEPKKAKPYLENAVRLDHTVFGVENINYAWDLLKLSDLYRDLGDGRAQSIYEKAISVFRLDNCKRLKREFHQEDAAVNRRLAEKIDRYVYGKKLGRDFSDTDSFLFDNLKTDSAEKVRIGRHRRSLWKNQYEAREAPGLVWLDPKEPLKALIIAVHGLGLHHGAYESFGRRIAREGIMTVAFDVRGFGTYLASKGSERLDMKACVQDLKRIVDVIRSDYPERPVFLLGESMGGAIVMRLGALYPDSIDGIICSVPSGNRYESTSTKVKVGLNFIKDRNQLVDISPIVVKQATTDEKLRHKWSMDPASRLRLSSSELLAFNKFMSKNFDYARMIERLPVLIFQGDEDRLVKSKGTYDLFEAVKSKDKTLVVVGGTEHLIFEAGQFRDGIALGVVGWIYAHSQAKAKKLQANSSM